MVPFCRTRHRPGAQSGRGLCSLQSRQQMRRRGQGAGPRRRYQATEDDNRYSRLVFGRVDCPISWLAIISSALTIAEWSQALPPCAVQELNNCWATRSEEHTSELQSRLHLVC